MKRNLLLIIVCISFFGISAQTLDKTLLFDFGPNDLTNGNSTTNPDVNGNYWNNIIDPSASATVSGLLTNTNTATSYA